MIRLPPYQFYEFRWGGINLERAFQCPVCDFPTLYQPEAYEICPLCSWEDDGYDSEGPNGDYTLAEARSNFAKHLSMYRVTRETELGDACRAKTRAMMEILKSFMQETDLNKRGVFYQAYIDSMNC